jgi:cell division protein FtsI/penicillin-binding protein 2
MYEPGSTFKPVTFAALLEQGLISLETQVYCEDGAWRTGRRTVRDHKPHGLLGALDVLAKSSNIGTAKLAGAMQESSFDSYIRKFGFSAATGIELPGEAAGQLSPVQKWSSYSRVSLAMGQEINVTALQMVCAFAAIANGGDLYRPRVIKRVVDEKGGVVVETGRKLAGRVVSRRTCTELTRAMTEVVETGTGTRAKSEMYLIAGKTGTAQKGLPGEVGYAPDKFVASFCGFAPANNPQICVIVVVNEPRGTSHFGGTVAAPVAGRIIEETLIYLRVPGDRKREMTGGSIGDARAEGVRHGQ